ncbi:uncharacterized protein BX663DRAFT_438519 [Cokeromyces recurvatus]|uniref:uncharacterized protein n=1 Tax=Cokeromyces recurvatus TaxID=90255 RepID=UPI00221FA31F|nr:uncharacterized protein BX663DRAFT_438519 [Cokeromyces recurvatus]KAI7901043.1 hypothetical protein BX663DRAFT_438519 [Cokeromyces recurvatus]
MTSSQEGHGLASISLTHVYFNPSDKISYAFAYITLSPIAILVFYASVIVSRREMAGILMLVGQLTNEVVNYILKETIEQERPYAHLGDGYGMPSSHSQFICIYLGYHTLNQVLIGSFVGALFGIVWYKFVNLLRTMNVIQFILDTAIAKKLYLKDMIYIDNVARWEYNEWLKERKKKENKQLD